MNKGRFTDVIKEAQQCLAKTEIKKSLSRHTELNISSIEISQKQPRKYFDLQKMKGLTQSIKENGILEPLLVRNLNQEKYELVAGERRLRAAIAAQFKQVPAIVLNIDEEQAFRITLLENLQREDLNPVEETEGIINLVAITLKEDNETIPLLLYKMQNEAKGKTTPNVWGTPEGDLIIEIFESLGLNWQTFIKTRLPLLKLPALVLDTLRNGSIEYTKALAISKIKDEKKQNELLRETIDLKLSLSQIKERIRKLNQTSQEQKISLKSRFTKAYTKAKKSKIWDDPKKKKQLEKIINDLETKLAKLLENG